MSLRKELNCAFWMLPIDGETKLEKEMLNSHFCTSPGRKWAKSQPTWSRAGNRLSLTETLDQELVSFHQRFYQSILSRCERRGRFQESQEMYRLCGEHFLCRTAKSGAAAQLAVVEKGIKLKDTLTLLAGHKWATISAILELSPAKRTMVQLNSFLLCPCLPEYNFLLVSGWTLVCWECRRASGSGMDSVSA